MRATFGALGLALSVVACDSSGGKPEVKASTFPDPDPLVEGRVLHGTESVAGAIVQLEATAGLGQDRPDAGDPGKLTTTELGGKYRTLKNGLFCDLSIRKDREVVVFRKLGVRYFDPPLGADAPVRGFTATVAARTGPLPAPGNAVAFFVSGAEARTVSGDAGLLVVTFRHFDAVLTLHAVEYVASGGLATAMRAGRTDIRVTNGVAVSTVVPLSPLDEREISNEVTFVAAPPAGFALSTLEVVMDLGVRTSAHPVARVAAGTPLHLGIVRGGRYFVRATATRDGAVSDSGLQAFDPFAKAVALTLPPPLTDTTFDGSDAFTAGAGNGVVEHVLAPSSADGVSLRIATADRATTLPDLIRLGLPRPMGRYVWTVQQFPTLKRIENLSGEDVRVFTPVSTTAPRAIDLR